MDIIVYTSEKCPHCPKVKQLFKDMEKRVKGNTVNCVNFTFLTRELSLYIFIYNQILTIPTVDINDKYHNKLYRYTGVQEIMDNLESIENEALSNEESN